MKKVLVFLFLIFLTLPFHISCAFLLYEKHQVKSEVKERLLKGMDRKDLVFLVFSKSKFLSLVTDNEFYYEGEMYDLVEVKEIGDYCHCWCWLDREESDLNRRVSLLVSEAMGEDSENEEGENVLSDFFELLYCHEQDTLQLPSQCVMDRKEFFYAIHYSFFYAALLIDPPETILV